MGAVYQAIYRQRRKLIAVGILAAAFFVKDPAAVTAILLLAWYADSLESRLAEKEVLPPDWED